MAFPMPTVISKNKTTTLGGQQFTRATLAAEINIQSKADLHSMLVGITREDTAQQQRMGNPPQLVEVDNTTNRPVESVERKVVVIFGTALARAAMRMAETELAANIRRATVLRTGRLSNVQANWEWRFIPRGGSPRVVTSGTPPSTLSQGDKLVLVPAQVPYATAVNRAVANSGRLTPKATGRRKSPPKSQQRMGFLAATTAALRRRSEFKQFAVYAEFTKSHAVAGEVYAHGTGVITIRPRFRVR